MRRERERQRGSATVEQAGLVTLVALVLIAAIAAIAAGGDVDSGRDLARAIGRKIGCAPRLPDGCRHHPLVPAYGWPLARLVRALAPVPEALPGAGGVPLAPVDFRRCRSEGCAARGRPTLFTVIDDRRADLGWVEITYWMYRPGLGWSRVTRRATQSDVDAAAGTRVLLKDDPVLVPLETLPGRDHYDFPAGERPPWQWRVRGLHPGWSS
jgi:Flp pilus assembly pilin Flp